MSRSGHLTVAIEGLERLRRAYGVAPDEATAHALATLREVLPDPDRAVVSLLAATRPGGDDVAGLALRALGRVEDQGDLLALGIESGLIDADARWSAFRHELMTRFGHTLMASGIDVRVGKRRHAVKGWIAFREPVSIEALLTLETLPPQARRHLPLFRALGYRGTTIFALDPEGTFNVYFTGRQRYLDDVNDARAVLERLGLAAPARVLPVLARRAMLVYPTFAFDPGATDLRRLCMGYLDTPAGLADYGTGLEAFAAYARACSGPVLSLAMGHNIQQHAEEYHVKAELQFPGCGALELMQSASRPCHSTAETLSMLARVARRHPIALGLTGLAQFGWVRPLITGLPTLPIGSSSVR